MSGNDLRHVAPGADPVEARSIAGLPADAEPCVWMTAGLVAWKLCDRDFDCESCPLDAALRGVGGLAPRWRETPAAEPAEDFPADRRYHQRHAWAAERPGGAVRLGVDAPAARLLGPPDAVILPAPGCRLRRGEAACWLVAGGELIAVRSPVTGTVERCNPRLHRSPGLIADAPYADGWLLEVGCVDAAAELARLLDAGAAYDRAGEEQRRLLMASAPASGVGSTLADGGEPHAEVRTLLGDRRWRRLIHALFD